MWGAYICMGAYKRNAVVVIKMGAYIHGVPIFVWVLINAMRWLQSKWVPIFMGCLFCVGAYCPGFTVF